MVEKWDERYEPPEVYLLHIYECFIDLHYFQPEVQIEVVILRHGDALQKQKDYELVEHWLREALLDEFELEAEQLTARGPFDWYGVSICDAPQPHHLSFPLFELDHLSVLYYGSLIRFEFARNEK